MPFTLTEADKKCVEAQYLIGLHSTPKGMLEIEKIVVTPADAHAKQRFYLLYMLFEGDEAMAFSQAGAGTYFDLTAIGKFENDQPFFEDLNNPNLLSALGPLPSALFDFQEAGIH